MLKPLHHYALENPPTVYDEEALTALELVGRIGALLNRVVEDQNNHRTDVRSELEQMHQDIYEAEQYMRDNIVGTTSDIVDELIKAGKLYVGIVYNASNESLTITVTPA